MKTILLFGAGRSATVLIDYLLEHAAHGNWQLILVDADLSLAKAKIGNSSAGKALAFDILHEEERGRQIIAADLVISLLPPSLHIEVARDCLKYSKNLLTASYVDPAIRQLEQEIKAKKLLFLYEMGLDPGIDHMSAMQLFDRIQQQGGLIRSFISHCGGLVAPESDDNPWHYKISWNARNIILAGKAGAHFLENGVEKNIPYESLFSPERTTRIPGIGELGWYPNRDSMSYITLYGLSAVETFIRTTLRHTDFLSGWKNLVALKLTDETAQYDTSNKTLRELFREHMVKNGFDNWMSENITGSTKDFSRPQQTSLLLEQLLYLGMDDNELRMDKGICSAADILQFAAEKKLSLRPTDKDLVVMKHEIGWSADEKQQHIQSCLVVKGKDSLHTAMAKTVGLPLAIAAKYLLQGKFSLTGLHIPTSREIYEPVLRELADQGLVFVETAD